MEAHIIKKYPNRRLYDTVNSCYINLSDVKNLIKQYDYVKVIETATNQDVTRSILLQVILEEELKNPLFTTNILQMLISIYGDSTSAMMSRFMEHSLEEFINQQGKLKSPLSSLHRGKNQAPSSLNQLTSESFAKWNKKSSKE